jgi:homoserine kinase type II
MAVLTAVAEADANAFLVAYGRGALRRLVGIPGGSVNSNFLLEAAGGRFFLRLYEERNQAGAEGEAAMLERLARAGVPTPSPLRRADGGIISVLHGKPAALFPWRDGQMRCQKAVSASDVQRVGEALARVHIAGAAEMCDKGRFNLPDLLTRLDRIASHGGADFAPMAEPLRSHLVRIQTARDPRVPKGLIHGDLFRDNVLWDGEGEIAALLDFESACEGTYAYDLMVTILSWCYADDLVPELARSMREGYENVRSLSPAEKAALCAEGCFAALRFTVTRITDYAMRTEAQGLRLVKEWRRFLQRFEVLEALGTKGLHEVLGISEN